MSPAVAPIFGTAANAWITPSMLIALSALAFTIASFWWMNVRRGRLSASAPHSFAASVAPDQVLLNLPLVFHNDGAAPIVVQNLRLRLERPAGHQTRRIGASPEQPSPDVFEVVDPLPVTMWWRGTRQEVQPRDGNRPLPAAFPVAGRIAVLMFIEFGLRRVPDSPLLDGLGGPCHATVEVRLAHRHRWSDLITFDLHTQLVNVDNYIAWPNDPDWQA
ncbi:hypothetical protein ACN26Y_00345 [Micromonospora sp. WMMD558]|uniref:hypothetical protein n=1 Tax=Micromonospora sp. WMMD558 TaxID=3403462 RepID=UPI003BF57AB4